ncbi:MAG: hypothetical protein QW756_04200 [Nitrososphaerota archaeon]
MNEECSHVLELLGEQKTEGGANLYYRCVKCGDVFVKTPQENKVYRVSGIRS